MEEAEGGNGFKYCDNLGELMEMTAVTRLYPPVPVKKWYIADSDLTVQEVLEVHAAFLSSLTHHLLTPSAPWATRCWSCTTSLRCQSATFPRANAQGSSTLWTSWGTPLLTTQRHSTPRAWRSQHYALGQVPHFGVHAVG
jgi:hypothetical protein